MQDVRELALVVTARFHLAALPSGHRRLMNRWVEHLAERCLGEARLVLGPPKPKLRSQPFTNRSEVVPPLAQRLIDHAKSMRIALCECQWWNYMHSPSAYRLLDRCAVGAYKRGMTLVQALEAGMAARRITTTSALAVVLEVGQSSASKWLRGLDVPDDSRAGAIASFTGTDEDTVLMLLAKARKQKREVEAEVIALRAEVAELRQLVAELERR